MDADTLDRICRDDTARRELLWLRARERADWLSVRLLEDTDPGIPTRLKAAGVDIEDDRSTYFLEAWDETYARHAARLMR